MGKKKKKDKGLASDITNITASGIGLGVGASVIGGLGPTAAPAASGITTAAGFLPTIATIAIGTRVVGIVSDLEMKVKHKKRKKRRKRKPSKT